MFTFDRYVAVSAWRSYFVALEHALPSYPSARHGKHKQLYYAVPAGRRGSTQIKIFMGDMRPQVLEYRPVHDVTARDPGVHINNSFHGFTFFQAFFNASKKLNFLLLFCRHSSGGTFGLARLCAVDRLTCSFRTASASDSSM